MRIRYLFVLVISLFIFGCIEPYDFDSTEVENTVVVDAELTDRLSVQEIKLSKFNKLDSQQFIGVQGATVSVEDDLGNQTIFNEAEPGIYQSLFEGSRDRNYRLLIDIPNGGEVTSDFSGFPPPVQIDSIVYEELKESFVNEDGKNR
ncbi:MAG: DUF4249 family protein, partial [Saprospiraceae bacterium]|nr:DUF4249 family protein [Saprospiraceae bacterium]